MNRNHPYYETLVDSFLYTAWTVDGLPWLQSEHEERGLRAELDEDDPSASSRAEAKRFVDNFLNVANDSKIPGVFRKYAIERYGEGHVAFLTGETEPPEDPHRRDDYLRRLASESTDFWYSIGQNLALTAAGHGSGFWDFASGPATDVLCDAARDCGYNGSEHWSLSSRPIAGFYRGILRY